MIEQFNNFFKRKSLASTYKPTLLKCLLDLGDYSEDEGGQWIKKDGDSFIVDLNFVAARFLRYYHPLKFKFNLKQEATSKRIAIYNILETYQNELGVKSTPTKKVWQVYGFMQDWDDNLHFTSFRINPLQAIWYKWNKARVVEKYCEYCEKMNQFVCTRWDKPRV